MLADDPLAFAEAVVTLLQQPQFRKTMACQGRAILRQEYTSIVNAARIKQLIECLCATESQRLVKV